MRNKKRNRVLFLLILLLGIGIGFAALATTLKINGTAIINRSTWNIYWDNVANETGVTPETHPQITPDENNVPKTLLTWSVTLNEPGDFYEFEVDAVNAGTLDAEIIGIDSKVGESSIISTVDGELVEANPSPVPSYIKYSVKYADGTAVGLGDKLSKAPDLTSTPPVYTRKTYKIRVEYDRDAVTNAQVNGMEDDVTLTFTYHVTYGQSSSSSSSGSTPSLALGDYFELIPDLTEYEITYGDSGHASQTINPSELTLWRVIEINDDGTYDAVSEYTSSTKVYLSGVTGYQKYASTLQKIASSYAKEGYTVGTRALGYGGQTLELSDTSTFDGTTYYGPNPTGFDGSHTPEPWCLDDSEKPTTGYEYAGGVAGDTLYIYDVMLMNEVYGVDEEYGTHGLKAYAVSGDEELQQNGFGTSYWIPSRLYMSTNGNRYAFRGRSVNSSGAINVTEIVTRDGNWYFEDMCAAVRPVIVLKSDVTIDNGTGTKLDPYSFN